MSMRGDWTTPMLEGRHVRLVPLLASHADALRAAAADGELWSLRYTSVPGPSPGEAEAYIATALAQREDDQPVPPGSAGPEVPRLPAECPRVTMPFAGPRLTYADLVETRLAQGRFFDGPCSAWFRLRHPLIAGEAPSPYQRVAVAADSGNGISAALDLQQWLFVNCDLTINLLRRPRGEWVCLQARSTLGGNGCGLAESALFDESGLVGRATQSLVVRRREGPASVQG